MLDIRFEINGRRLDPCFIADSVEKAALLRAANLLREKFRDVLVPDSEDPLKVLIKGADVDHLRFEVDGPPSALDQIRDRSGVVPCGAARPRR